jgi:hypothetical protein
MYHYLIMKIFYISLGSFCHPKILLRETNRLIQESLPFDFHSTPGTYTIYNILEELYKNKKYDVDFKEILYTHKFNNTNKNELVVREKNDIFFLHFFDVEDLKEIPLKYPVDASYIDENKIKLIKYKFNKRFNRLYNLMNDPDNVLVFLRIENYANPVWDEELVKLTNAISLFQNNNKFLIYSQTNIDEKMDFYKTNALNYNYKIPVMCVKKLFDETIQNVLRDDFLNVLTTFEKIINRCLQLRMNNNVSNFYHDIPNKKLFKLNDLSYWMDIEVLEGKTLICMIRNKVLVFELVNNIFELQ